MVERRIVEAIENGEFDNLLGRGAPLTLDDLARDENLAHSLLVRNGFSLPWIEIWKQIDLDRSRVAERLTQRKRWLESQEKSLGSSPRWADAVQEFRLEIHKLNQRIDEYNLKVQLAQFQRRRLNPDAELERLTSN